MPNSKEASMAKAKAGRTANAITLGCVELLGALGYSEDELLEKWARDSKILDIFEGTQQIQQLIIARRLLGVKARLNYAETNNKKIGRWELFMTIGLRRLTTPHVSLVNILGSVVQGLPELGVTLKGVAALVTTKPEKKKIHWFITGKTRRQSARPYCHPLPEYYLVVSAAERSRQPHCPCINQPGHRCRRSVGVMLENRPESLIAVMAIVKLGAIAGMINTSQRGEVLEHSTNLIQPKALLWVKKCWITWPAVNRRPAASLKATAIM